MQVISSQHCLSCYILRNNITGGHMRFFVTATVVLLTAVTFQNCTENRLVLQNLNLSSDPSQMGNFKKLVSGRAHSCVITKDDTVMCWGFNDNGQLGDGTTNDSLVPRMVRGLNEVKAIALGTRHSCAIIGDDTVKCWGNNATSQLGNNTNVSSLVPVDVFGLTGIKEISSYNNHTCALTNLNTIKCWGSNQLGELGSSNVSPAQVPVEVVTLSGIKAIDVGGSHTCAITNSDTVKCWGYNEFSQLGNQTIGTYSTVPLEVRNLGVVKAIAIGGNHSCAITFADTVNCWGRNLFGQLGNGTTQNSGFPVNVSNVAAVKSLAAGGQHSCAVTQSNTVKCWGNGSFGQLGNGSTALIVSVAVEINNLAAVSALALGENHSCAIGSTSNIICWGNNSTGQLGINSNINSLVPVEVNF